MNWFKRALRANPTPEGQGFSPSPLALKLATKSTTDYQAVAYANPVTDKHLKIMVVCTEEQLMTMENGKQFVTGNHPVELLVPLLHFEAAGFEFEFYTPTGRPVQIEHWAMPSADQPVQDIFNRLKEQMDHPNALSDITPDALPDLKHVAGLFIPGGHGAMLGLPENETLGQLIRHLHEADRYILSICHGPAALLSTATGSSPFLFKGYRMAVFPDSMDRFTPTIGYMPGAMPWYFGEKLKAEDVDIVNKQARGTCHQDRKLITGDSPDAANRFGKLAAEAMLADETIQQLG